MAWRCGFYIIFTVSFISCEITMAPDFTAIMTTDHETHRCETKLAACSIKFDGTTMADHLRGPKGDKGEKGDQGPAGSCGCVSPPVGVPPTTTGVPDYTFDICGDEEDCLSSSTMPSPRKIDSEDKALISCKHAPVGTTNGTYFLRAEDPFKVFCDMNRNLSCLITAGREDFDRYYFKHDHKPFWISEKNNSKGEKFNLRQFYGYEVDQIEWLQRHSSFVTQTIRYYCYNSWIYPDAEKALHLLSWTDSLIGSQPTNLTPAYYTIASDECKNSTKGWKHADIVIIGSPRRLPIIDFHIQDIRKKDQRFILELRELCFG